MNYKVSKNTLSSNYDYKSTQSQSSSEVVTPERPAESMDQQMVGEKKHTLFNLTATKMHNTIHNKV